jgi:hypothetical protein
MSAVSHHDYEKHTKIKRGKENDDANGENEETYTQEASSVLHTNVQLVLQRNKCRIRANNSFRSNPNLIFLSLYTHIHCYSSILFHLCSSEHLSSVDNVCFAFVSCCYLFAISIIAGALNSEVVPHTSDDKAEGRHIANAILHHISHI